MRRAVHQGTVPRRAAPPAPPSDIANGFDTTLRFADCSTSTVDSAPDEVLLSTAGTFANGGECRSDVAADRNRHLAVAIVQRIESRLPGRVRNLSVRILADTVVLEGACATYYTKQLAQHAALGILEDEHLENAIVVTIGR
ncbi:MAG: hypothetical protein L0228_13420 [Planctomycetes bacterium]|nr:hypothetical protein [Planctomycetota bacterium]